MIGLIDATGFYSACEKVYDPQIRNKPVVCVSNNDGCIVAMCPIARALGVPKFEPLFKVRKFLDQAGVVIRSSNYELYADLSERMMTVIGRFAQRQHIYSIDESFITLPDDADYQQVALEIRKAVWREVKLPVGVGIANTATLAKAANHAAKRIDGYRGICVIDDEQHRIQVLSKMGVADVWGVGRRLAKKLKLLDLTSALDLSRQPPKDIRKQFSVVLERTVNELNGIKALDWDDVKAPKQQIFSTRSFGEPIRDIDQLASAFATHGATVAYKARQQDSYIKRLIIFAASSPFKEKRYAKTLSIDLVSPSNDTLVINNAIRRGLTSVFMEGVDFIRCGVGAVELQTGFVQTDLLSPSKDSPALMSCLDAINNRYGAGALHTASTKQSKWHMRREYLSPHYTTRWHDVPRIKC
ncbi:Y-family DNA polymerase [Thalassotalea maritima]|uniref:Y-family DNA polymerase n=1 Tax=Thalassotalea maritima TaxID=3242416 RepID=UPI00352816AF